MKLIKFFVLLVAIVFAQTSYGQKYFTRSGKISFSSDAALEQIEAVNQKATSVLDSQTGKMEFAILIKAFQFEKALMQEHFNENYMESDKYPKAIFKGAITDLSKVDFGNDGKYQVDVKGDLCIHGITNSVVTAGIITVSKGNISAAADFEVAVADYKIEIPNIVKDNIAKIVEIQVAIDYELFNKKS